MPHTSVCNTERSGINAPDLDTGLDLFERQPTETHALDITDGTPWRTEVLGKYTGPTRDMVLRARILETPGVTAITAYDSALNRDTRAFTAQATISTQYGATTVQVPV